MRSPGLHWISSDAPVDAFPEIDNALAEPDGLLAAGGDLSRERLIYAYRHGIFPWFDEGQPILWWSPNPRCVLRPDAFHVSRRLRRSLRRAALTVSFNRRFCDVMAGCAAPRPGQLGTWITEDMKAAYLALHEDGWAHSIEVWQDDRLAGGLYGLAIGRMFFGESMYSGVEHASKAALLVLTRIMHERGFPLLDCQVASPHLLTLGAMMMPRRQFREVLDSACEPPIRFRGWPDAPVSVTALL